MASLYQLGWRQGSVLVASLQFTIAECSHGSPETQTISHERWIVASQDCDLDAADSEGTDPQIELRPVYDRDGGPPFDLGAPDAWGVRSRKFRLNLDRDFIHADAPRLMATPALLSQCVGSPVSLLSEERRSAFTSWLGRRYDRPAVPDRFVPLARAVSRSASKTRHRVRDHLHDLLLVFSDSSTVPRVSLFAITCDPDHEEECCDSPCSDDHVTDARLWMSELAQALDIELGVVERIEAAPRAETSMLIVESSYSADVSDITYGGMSASGAG